MRTRHALPCAALLLAAGGACAQSSNDPDIPRSRYEVTPFLGYRVGGTLDIRGSAEDGDVDEHMSFALALNYHVDTFSSYEIFYSRQPTQVTLGDAPGALDLDVSYLMIGGTQVIETMSAVQPYLVGSAGLGRFSLDAPDADAETVFALSLGVGVRLHLRERLDARLETRAYVSFVDSNSSMFCRSGATGSGCFFQGNGSTFPQFEFLAGVAWGFR